MAPVIRSVTVFCGSSDSVDRKYFAAAEELGAKLARRGWRLIYGGGGVGLMGSLARAVLAHGGEVTGIIPKALLELGVGDTGLTELVVTDGLRDRKAIMDERGDAFVALPGGLGTLEEVLEALTLKQLGYHRKPIAVLDLHGFFDPLWAQFQRGIDEGFIKPEFLDLWYPAPDIDALLRYLDGYEPHGYGLKWTRRTRTSSGPAAD
ncbi:MAG: TIGR00730 family Rossman fold protein [Candidatus Rokuibacteriota bacterium]|nr:MAG: TIGR00730 family Rossman fold protein [Candidatus Rokubacteria bacterium]PYM56834.1 MAG: TIGR00730 family Rossman fold protein [Candidatus Rokubacteria bacterium]PYM70116.1 MAG: TIGR00730 family Rossman fold protein [Candidatus Rokubacteria bacterium]